MGAAVHTTHLYLGLVWAALLITDTAGACDQVCTADFDPVCGSDGITYSNLCVLQNAICSTPSLEKVSDGGCGCDLRCKDTPTPVCGSNNVTYTNICFLNAAKCTIPQLYMDHVRKCNDGCDKVCPEIYAPVCGSDAITYDNECFFLEAKCRWEPTTIVRRGHCSSAIRSSTPTLVTAMGLVWGLLLVLLY